jgi:tetraacyldisaccharide 4'-kinase
MYFYNIITGKSRVIFGSILKPLLILLSFLFFIAVKARCFFYKIGILRSVKLKRPVISVGNITWGGTGKTPLTEALLHRFLQKRKRVALLTRGYGKDEERVIFQNFPEIDILSGKRRLFNALQAQENSNLDFFLMDDGFQHLSIRRDADIVTINATDPIGNGFLIPAGILREPLNSLKRADMVIITKSDLVDKERLVLLKHLIQSAAGDINIFEGVHEPAFFYTAFNEKRRLGYIRQRRACAVSGLADNNSFSMTLKQLGALVVSRLSYMDHHKYVKTDIAEITKAVEKNNADIIVTTEKDWIKLKSIVKDPSLKGVELLVLKIELKVKDDEVFYRRLSALLSG